MPWRIDWKCYLFIYLMGNYLSYFSLRLSLYRIQPFPSCYAEESVSSIYFVYVCVCVCVCIRGGNDFLFGLLLNRLSRRLSTCEVIMHIRVMFQAIWSQRRESTERERKKSISILLTGTPLFLLFSSLNMQFTPTWETQVFLQVPAM